MAVIDSELLEQIRQAGGKRVPVIITCTDRCEPVVEALKQTGVLVTSTDSMILGSIGAVITADQLDVITSMSGIDTVEYDQEARELDR